METREMPALLTMYGALALTEVVSKHALTQDEAAEVIRLARLHQVTFHYDYINERCVDAAVNGLLAHRTSR